MSIYLLAIAEREHTLTTEHFQDLAGHNPDLVGCVFEGQLRILYRYCHGNGLIETMYQMNDAAINYLPLTVVLAFNMDFDSQKDCSSIRDHHQDELVNILASYYSLELNMGNVKNWTMENGNYVLVAEGMNHRLLGELFATHARQGWGLVNTSNGVPNEPV